MLKLTSMNNMVEFSLISLDYACNTLCFIGLCMLHIVHIYQIVNQFTLLGDLSLNMHWDILFWHQKQHYIRCSFIFHKSKRVRETNQSKT